MPMQARFYIAATTMLSLLVAFPLGASKACPASGYDFGVEGPARIDGTNVPYGDLDMGDVKNGVTIRLTIHDATYAVDGSVSGLCDLTLLRNSAAVGGVTNIPISGRAKAKATFRALRYNDSDAGLNFGQSLTGVLDESVKLVGNSPTARVTMVLGQKYTEFEDRLSGDTDTGDYIGSDRMSFRYQCSFFAGDGTVYSGKGRTSADGHFFHTNLKAATSAFSLQSANNDGTVWSGDANLTEDGGSGSTSTAGGHTSVTNKFHEAASPKPGTLVVSSANDAGMFRGVNSGLIANTKEDIVKKINGGTFDGINSYKFIPIWFTGTTPAFTYSWRIGYDRAYIAEWLAAP